MSENISIGSNRSAGPDFNLSDEILSVIPTDPYEQLDLARKITSMAIASRVTNLECEISRLRHNLNGKDRVIVNLEDKGIDFFVVTFFGNPKMKMSKERDDLFFTAKKLARDLTKLETFKRQLMQSLSDDDSSQAETVDIGTYDQSVHKSYPLKEEVNGYTAHHSFGGSVDGRGSSGAASKQALQRFSSPYLSPLLTPSDAPKITSASVSPRGYSAAVSPQRTSGSTSPTIPQFQRRVSVSSFYPSSQQSSAANSPPRARPKPAQTPRVDGKEFFRQARIRLSYEQFSAFLANIKELNAQKQSREETLKKAEEIFGMDNKDLYLSFQGMLNRGVR
ncbi:putative hsp70/Hsp90 co-chaperone cns1-like [Capsicum annuum]|nr:putative hsp70/Hsp90 co-chaperone cns1-like [Capsicum annuum]